MPRSLRSALTLTILCLGSVALAQTSAPARSGSIPPPTQASKPANTAAGLAWRNAATDPPPGWTGPVFQLSHNYPQKDPGVCPNNVCQWLSMPKEAFTAAPGVKQAEWNSTWAEYMGQLLAYIREGQDLQLDNKVGWKVDVSGSTRWFHMPWMAYDPKAGREFVHGLTNERTAEISDFFGNRLLMAKGLTKLSRADMVKLEALGQKTLPLTPKMARQFLGQNTLPLTGTTQTSNGFETWAFGVYNEWGAYAIGQTWNPDGTPRINSNPKNGSGPQPAGLPFPSGTLVAKLLFTTATPAQVPYLEGSPVWQADRHVETENGYLCQRQVQEVRLIQMDVAVVDSNSPTRWVYGTFAYDGKLKGATAWERLVPVGVQWGNDPWSAPATSKADSLPIVQSVLNKAIGTPQHFGCNNRLAGPVDNKLSSCMACHANAYTPPSGVAQTDNNTPVIFGFPGQCTTQAPENANYFVNNQFPMSYSGGQYPNLMNMDTSLQLWDAFLKYGQFNQAGAPQACKNPDGT